MCAYNAEREVDKNVIVRIGCDLRINLPILYAPAYLPPDKYSSHDNLVRYISKIEIRNININVQMLMHQKLMMS